VFIKYLLVTSPKTVHDPSWVATLLQTTGRIIYMLCNQTSPKRWLANMNTTSYCDVTNSVYPVTMTTIRHCSIIEFGRGHTIKKSPWASPDLCTPLHRVFEPGKAKSQYTRWRLSQVEFSIILLIYKSFFKEKFPKKA